MRQSNSSAIWIFELFALTILLISPHYSLAQRAYVPNAGSSSVSVIDTGTNAVLATIPVGLAPTSAAVTPSGSKVYVTNSAAGSVSVIDASNNTVVKTIVVGKYPLWVAVTPDGAAAYVANAASNSASVINTSTDAVVSTVAVGSNPVRITISGGRAYVANAGSKSISVIDTATKSVIATTAVGFLPTSVELIAAGSSGGSGGTPSSQPLEALPVSLDTIQAAIDLLTASGNAATPVSCGSSLILNCAGGVPSNAPAQMQFFRSGVSVSDNGVALPNTTYSFTATLSAATLNSIPITIPIIGDCNLALDTAQGSFPTINVTGNANFTSHTSGDPINEVDFSGLQVAGLEAADVGLSGGFGCSIASLGVAPPIEILTETLLGRVSGGHLCGVVGPALFQQCPQ